jgi:hypothetical protein
MASWDDAIKAQQGGAAAAAPSGSSWDQIVKPVPLSTDAPKPQAPGDFFTKYLGVAPASELDPNWKPSGNSLKDFFTRPMAKTEGVVPAASDTALSIGDYATLGFGGKMLGPGAQQTIAQAHRNMGLMDYGAQAIGYAGPGSVLGPAARGIVGAVPGVTSAGAGLATRVGAGAAAGGLEGAAAGAAGTYGHNQGWDDLSNVGQGALMGGITGAAGGVASRGEAGPTQKGPTEAEVGQPGRGGAPTGMVADKEKAYAPLNTIYFDNPSYAGPISTVRNAINLQNNPLGRKGIDVGITPEIDKIVNDVASQSSVTAKNLQEASYKLRNNIDNGANPVAHRFADALDSTLSNGAPSPGSVGATGAPAQVGEAAAAQKAGNALYQKIQDLNRLGADPSELTKAAVKQTMSFPSNAPGTAQGDALAKLYGSLSPSFSPFAARHILAPVAGAGTGALEGYVNAAEGQDPYTNALIHSGEEAMLFHGLHSAAAPKPAANLNAARFTIGTGRPLTTTGGDIGNAILRATIAHAASGYPQPDQSQ